jgi:endonuclease III
MKLQISPYNTRQEEYRDDPWKMLMVCFMLNQTSHKQVDQVRHEFFDRFPTPEALIAAEESEIASMIKTLGFYNRRAKSWKEFSKQWMEAVEEYGTSVPISLLEKMRGVGRYALDSWKVFQLFHYDIEVDDHVLNWYVDWARQEVERLAREASPWKPMVVYYLHFKDDRYFVNNWNKRGDYVCCVMARTIGEAIEKTEKIALNQQGAYHIKIMGISNGIEEWVDEEKPLTTDEEYHTKQVTALFERINNNKAA